MKKASSGKKEPSSGFFACPPVRGVNFFGRQKVTKDKTIENGLNAQNVEIFAPY